MDEKEVYIILRHLFTEELEVSEECVWLDAKLKEDMGIDSLDVIDVIVLIHEKFRLKIMVDELRGLKTMRDLSNLVTSKLASGSQD